jgi:NADPH:quinone reductase-like Zn-dependent oxidoreductase
VRAAYVERLGAPSEIRYGELPDPVPGRDEVLVEVTATVVDPVDTFVRSGRFPTPTPFPFVAVPADRLYRLPDGVDPLEAVGVLHPAATAHLALFTHGGLADTVGRTVYVAGGAGHVGRAAVLMAARAGARVVASAGSADQEEVHRLGAEVVLDHHAEHLADELRAACPHGVDVHLDTSGRASLAAAVDLLALRGRAVVVSGTVPEQTLPVARLYTHDRTVTGFVISHATVAELADAARHLNRLLAEGVLRPAGTEVLTLADTATAHRRLEHGAARGTRLVLVPER